MTDRRIRKGIPCLGYESRTAACVAFRDKGMGLSDIAKLTGVTTHEVKQMYESGASIKTIAAKTGLGKSTIWERLHKAGVKMRPRGRPCDPERDARIVGEYIDGKTTMAAIARFHGITQPAVAYILRKYGARR